jgi:hypothetical protein
VVKVTPENWEELCEALKARVLDRDIEIDWSKVPEIPPTMTIPFDLIVSAQPMARPVHGVWREQERKGSIWVDKKH